MDWKKLLTKLSVSAYLCILTSALFAESYTELSTRYIKKAHEMHLSKRVAWRRFLYYDKNNKSQVITRDFFTNENPKASADEEMQSHILLLFEAPTAKHVTCRLPARSHWLIEELEIPKSHFEDIHCPDYERFRAMLAPKTVWITFASYYLDSPSSSYGHTLLRLSKTKLEDSEKQNDLLDYGITFGANVDTSNVFVYAYKGLFGGFNGTFSALPYYFKIREYADFESRDLWSYNIGLNEKQISRLLDLLWELDGIYFPYFFLSKNCSSYLLSVLDAIDERFSFQEKVPYYVIPIETIKALYKEPTFVRKVQFRPSNRRQFWAQYHSLNKEEQKIYNQFIHIKKKEMPLLAYNDTTQMHLLDTAIAQFDYIYAEDLKDSKGPLYDRKRNYLSRRSKIPIRSEEIKITPKPDESPHLGHSPEKWALGFGLLKDYKAISDPYIEGDFRFSFHELEDSPQGHHFSRLNMFELKARYYTQGRPRIRVHKMGLLDIFNLAPLNRYEQKGSWQVELSLNDFLETNYFHKYGLRFKGAYGLSYEPLQSPKIVLYSLIGSRLDSYEHDNTVLRADPALGLSLGAWTSFFSNSDALQVELSRYYLPLAHGRKQASFTSNTILRYSFDLGRTRLHLSYERKDILNAFEVRLSSFL